jgi:hypothetical protein
LVNKPYEYRTAARPVSQRDGLYAWGSGVYNEDYHPNQENMLNGKIEDYSLESLPDA